MLVQFYRIRFKLAFLWLLFGHMLYSLVADDIRDMIDQLQASTSSNTKSTTSYWQKYCRFAPLFSCDSLTNDDEVASVYEKLVMLFEGQFIRPGIGYDAATGYTYDGHPLDYATGELWGEPHLFSAPSKECIHLAILALAVRGDPNALLLVGGRDQALTVLDLKLKSYYRFNATYPGYGWYSKPNTAYRL